MILYKGGRTVGRGFLRGENFEREGAKALAPRSRNQKDMGDERDERGERTKGTKETKGVQVGREAGGGSGAVQAARGATRFVGSGQAFS